MGYHTPKPPTPNQLERLKDYRVDIVNGRVYNPWGYECCRLKKTRCLILITADRKSRPLYRSHIIWWAATGFWPTSLIDHIDQNPSNDCFDNLREATQLQNAHNSKPYKRRKYDLPKGVYYNPACTVRPYTASIIVNYKKHRLGYYATVEEAVAARVGAEKSFGTHFSVEGKEKLSYYNKNGV